MNLLNLFGRKGQKQATKSVRPTLRKLSMETMEERRVMAGNVAVKFDMGDVVITGDNASNAIRITQPTLDTYVVSGSVAGGSATKINGVAGGTFTFKLYDARYNDDIVINMNGGDDSVSITGDSRTYWDIDAHDSYFINMGSGDDSVVLDYVEAQDGDLSIDLGTGRDSVRATNVTVGDDLLISKYGTVNSNGSVTDRAAIRVANAAVKDDLNIYSSRSVDTVNVVNTSADDFYIALGLGDDSLNLYRSTARKTYNIDGGDGVDNLNLYANTTNFKPTAFKTPTAINNSYLY